MTYDKWKTTDPDAEFLGDKAQEGERSQSGETKMSDFITQVADRIGELEKERDQLRELNAELWEIVAAVYVSDVFTHLKPATRDLINKVAYQRMVEHDTAKAEKIK
jgi:hypothetical protein